MEDVSVLALFGRLVVSLAVVLGLMAVAARLLRRRGLGGIAPRGHRAVIEVVARHGLSRGASIAVVRAAGKALVVGVTDAGVSLLAEADPETLDHDMDADRTSDPRGGSHPAQAWKTVLDGLRERTVRRS